MKPLMDALTRVAVLLAAISLLLIAAVQLWQVYARYVLNDSPGWSEPVALLLMNTALFCGAAVGVRREQHFSFSLLLDAAQPSLRRWLQSLTQMVVLALGILLVWGGAVLYAAEADVVIAGTRLSEGARFLPLCLGGALMGLFALERLWLIWQCPEEG